MREDKKAAEAEKKDKTKGEEPAAGARRSSAASGVLKVLVPAVLAAGASYGGTRYARAQNAVVVVKENTDSDARKHETPGPTLTLDPFLLSVFDANKKAHPMKLSIAVELSAKAAGHDARIFTPRIRDAVLTHLRKLSYEEIADPAHFSSIRKELLEDCKDVGAEHAEKVLVTDFVIQ